MFGITMCFRAILKVILSSRASPRSCSTRARTTAASSGVRKAGNPRLFFTAAFSGKSMITKNAQRPTMVLTMPSFHSDQSITRDISPWQLTMIKIHLQPAKPSLPSIFSMPYAMRPARPELALPTYTAKGTRVSAILPRWRNG